MEKKRILLIQNKKAGKHKNDENLVGFNAYHLGSIGVSITPDGKDALKEQLRIYKALGIEVIAICGGDGTINFVMSAVVDVYNEEPKQHLPKFAFIPCGTMNTIPRGCGVKGRAIWLLHNLVRKMDRGEKFEIARMNTIQVDGRTGFLFAGGMVSAFMDDYYGKKDEIVTPWRAFTKVFLNILLGIFRPKKFREKFKPFKGQLYVNNVAVYKGELSLPFVTTVPQIGFGAAPFNRVHEKAGHFQVLAFKKFSIWSLIREIPYAMIGTSNPYNGKINFVAKEVTFRSSDGTSMYYTIDGDMKRSESVTTTISAGPVVEIIQQ
jgi:diacylglycerol kinase family enzyme